MLAGVLGLVVLVAAAVPNDPLVTQQTHLNVVRAYEAWDLRRGEDAVVAVLDTGVDLDHPDLVGRLVEGVDLVEPDTPPDDPQGHGTLVAGIIVANADNARGVAGAAPRASVMPIRVLDAQGRGTSDLVAAGIRHAIDHGADVINLSLAEVEARDSLLSLSLVADTEVQRAVQEAADAGLVVVAAAGNDADDRTPYDVDAPVVVVGATDDEDRVWEDSNVDDRTLFAPGVSILSTWYEGRYAKADGTSFATPIVAAGAAMLAGAGLEADDIRARLADTAVDVGAGVGRLDLAAAVEGLPAAPIPSGPPPEPPPTTPPADPAATSADPAADPGALGQVQPVEEVLPAATVTEPPPPIATIDPDRSTASPTEDAGAEIVVDAGREPPSSATPTPSPRPLVVDESDGTGAVRSVVIPLAISLLGIDVLLVGWVLGRTRDEP